MTIIETQRTAPVRRGSWARGAAAVLAAAALILGAGVGTANAAPGDALRTGGPTLTVTSGYDPVTNGTTITVNGSGYDAATLSPTTGAVAGLYLSIGSVDGANWRPSTSAAPTSRHAAKTIWVHPGGSGSDEANLSGSTTTNGSFSVSFTVPQLYTKAAADTWAVFTIGAHGVANAAQEQGREINYTGTTTTPPSPGAGTPSVTINKVGSTITAWGTGYGAASATGIYVSIGVIDTTNGWRPSAGKPSTSRVAADTWWTWSGGPTTPAAGQARLTSGAFGPVTFSTASLPVLPAGFSYAVYTIGAHGAVNASVETATLFTP